MPRKNVYERRAYDREYRHKNRERDRDKHNLRFRERTKKLRLETIKHYSNGAMKCECCSVDKLEFLAVDHINGGGNKARKVERGSRNIYEYLRKNDYPPGYRILCHNCNCSLGFYGYCPHSPTVNQ